MNVKINQETADFIAVCDAVFDALSDNSCDEITTLFNRLSNDRAEYLGDGEFKINDDDEITGFVEVMDKIRDIVGDFSGDELAELYSDYVPHSVAVYQGDSLFILFNTSDLDHFESADDEIEITEDDGLFGYRYEGINESCQYRSRHEALAQAYLKCVDEDFVF